MSNKHHSVTPNENGAAMIAKVRNAVSDLDALIVASMPNAEERRYALKALAECRMWSIQGIAHNNAQ